MSTGKSILLVDDSRGQRRLVRELFLDAHPDTRFYALENGEQAVEHLARCALGEAPAVDLVLLDRDMPRMDGFATLERIRAISALASLPILMLTGSADPAHIDRARALGASDYLVKPPEQDQWEAWIQRIGRWQPEQSRWAVQEIVRSPCATAARLVPSVDTGAVVIMTARSAEQSLVILSEACELAQISVRRALATHETDHILDAKRRLVVRYLMAAGWSDYEIGDYLPFGKRYMQERRTENARQPLAVCGSRALALK